MLYSTPGRNNKMRRLNKTLTVLSLAITVSGICGCGQALPAEEPAGTEETVNTDAGSITETENEGNTYSAIYRDKINELSSEGLADQFALANIDEDGIPELIASDSNGSFDHENAYIFTICNDEAVLLAGVITGVDGGCLDYAEGANLIHVSGAAAGMREVFSKIREGRLEEAFCAEASGMDEDAQYSVNGSSVSEKEYYEKVNEFAETYDPFTRIAYDGLYDVSYFFEDGYGGFEQGSSKQYSSAEEIMKELN